MYNYVRISETALKLVDWDDVCNSDETQSIKVQKMTEALIYSSQEFIKSDLYH